MTLDVERFGAVLRLTLNRPEKRNALNTALITALVDEVTAAGRDPDTSVVVIRGAGSCFSSGWDLSEKLHGTSDLRADREAVRAAGVRMNAIFDCPLPVIAQVHGYCLAGAADLALHCDLMLVARDARFGHPAVRSLGVPSSNMWLYRAGPVVAKHLLFTGDTISGDDTARLGLALGAYDAGALEGEVLALASRIAMSSRDTLMANKRVINHGIELMGRSALQRFAQAEDLLAHLSPSADAFRDDARGAGLAAAFRKRDDPFDER